MTITQMPSWMDLQVPPQELRLDPTLTCGQAFRWKPTGPNEWTCALQDRVIDLKQTNDTVLFRVLGQLPKPKVDSTETMLRDYFQLHVGFDQLCNDWTQVDPDFAKLRHTHMGVRTLRQPVVENLLTFIASSNNNIKRITMLVDKLCGEYGCPIDTPKGRFFTFPTITRIARDTEVVEETLRGLGFGYRAKYYAATVKALSAEHKDPEAFLEGLRQVPLNDARSELLKLSGVGPKIADCVCLMSLDKCDAVPIDTHIWQVAQRRYVSRILAQNNSSDILARARPEKRNQIMALARQLSASKKPTQKLYGVAQQLFILLFGSYAGWAQGLLFSSDLTDTKPKKRTAEDTEPRVVNPSSIPSTQRMRLRSTNNNNNNKKEN